jgi:hypothetical protein
MNHTIKGILIVAEITSMLVLGATTIPIMQNSFAHKRSAESNTNTNTNTNSATSDSDSTATATNTNNINNTATASQSQEQDACAVAVTCPEGSTTVTSTPPPATGTLEIFKYCAPSCPDTEFHITLTGNSPVTPPSFNIGDGGRQTVTLGSGTFTIHEVPTAGFSPSFEDGCMQSGSPGEATGTISAGQTVRCIITNNQDT